MPTGVERPTGPSLQTPRLLLRQWRAEDLQPFAAMSTDASVMEYLPSTLTRVESEAFVARARAHFVRYGFGLWAVEAPRVSDFIGYVGLAVPRFTAAFTPCVEVGWRLARPYWGFGYATEAARASLAFGFTAASLTEIVSFTTAANTRSRAVMERLGMSRDPAEDFDHPSLPEHHPLRPHVLYRLSRTTWLRDPAAGNHQVVVL